MYLPSLVIDLTTSIEFLAHHFSFISGNLLDAGQLFFFKLVHSVNVMYSDKPSMAIIVGSMICFVKIYVPQIANSSLPCPLSFNLTSYLRQQFRKSVCYFLLLSLSPHNQRFSFLCCLYILASWLLSNGCCCCQGRGN